MNQDSFYVIMIGIMIMLLAFGIVIELVSPANFSLYMIPAALCTIILWLNAWRIAKNKRMPNTQSGVPE